MGKLNLSWLFPWIGKEPKKVDSPSEIDNIDLNDENESLVSSDTESNIKKVEVEVEVEDEKIPVNGIALQLMARAVGIHFSRVTYKYEKKLGTYIVTMKLVFSREQSYYINLIIDSAGNHLIETTKSLSTERTMRLSENFLRNNTEVVLKEIREAFESRLKGFRAEQRFENMLRMVLKEHSVSSQYHIDKSNYADKNGVDFLIRNNKDSSVFLFQIKSSDHPLIHRTFRGVDIYKVVVNSTKSDADLKNEIWSLIKSFITEKKAVTA